MAARAEKRPPRRQPLTRERVLRAATKLADEGGIESLTMRKLARALGVEAMSLYNHVANKEDVLDGILDSMMAEIGSPPADAGWKEQVRGIPISAPETFRRHQWAAGF